MLCQFRINFFPDERTGRGCGCGWIRVSQRTRVGDMRRCWMVFRHGEIQRKHWEKERQAPFLQAQNILVCAVHVLREYGFGGISLC